MIKLTNTRGSWKHEVFKLVLSFFAVNIIWRHSLQDKIGIL